MRRSATRSPAMRGAARRGPAMPGAESRSACTPGTWVLTALVLAMLLGGAMSARASNIRSTKHNLSVSGPGTVKALSETRVCVFCHTPHNADPAAPLWNRSASGATYSLYSSSTSDASAGQPTGSSRLCLSCHDGTIALGGVLSEDAPIDMAGGATMPSGSRAHLGTDLGDDHPVSFEYDPALAAADGALVDPTGLTGDVRLDGNGELQCTTCHDPHDDTFEDFLVVDPAFGALCETCHVLPGWDSGVHGASAATWDGSGPDPWPETGGATVAENACAGCHLSHGPDGAERLLTSTVEEDVCLACHNGHVAADDMAVEFAKTYAHPIASSTGIHDPTEPALVTSRHVECVDCHDPHAAADGPDFGAVTGVAGIDGDGNEIDPVTAEWQVCYRCHTDSPGLPAPDIPRDVVETNLRVEFDPSNPSFHPVEAPGANANVPSLLPPWTTGSQIRCVDCHTNDDGAAAGGSGPDGPHGSNRPWLLGWRYDTNDPNTESPAAYELCYRCHDRASILGDDSFDHHDLHIRDERTPCSVCHDPHGIDPSAGDELRHTNLINFDVSSVAPHPGNGRREFIDNGLFRGECTLRCHNDSHSREDY